MNDTSQKIALITGASRGFGAAFAEEIAQTHHVIAVAKTVGGLEELDDRIQAAGGSATLVPMDITDEEALKRLCISIHERWGGVDIWCHAAIHAAPLTLAHHIDKRDWQKTLDINVTAAQQLIQNVEPLLLARMGTAIHLDDPRGGQKYFGSYGTSKTAQKALFNSWQLESKLNILSFLAHPMPTATRARFFPGEDQSELTPCKNEAKRLIANLSI